MKQTGIFLLTTAFILSSCNGDREVSDAYGNFESIPVMVSAEAAGKLLQFNIEEGQRLKAGIEVGILDTMQLYLNKQQVWAAMKTIRTRQKTLSAQINTQNVQLSNMEREYDRILKLHADGAATSKQKDDLEGSIALLKSQVKALETQKATLLAEREALGTNILQLDDQMKKAHIINPIEGIVLQKYKQEGEITAPGQSLYKVANLDKLVLRAYISGDQLAEIKLGSTVTVKIDGKEGMIEKQGLVSWISSEAEFTPKIIQTREERVNLVYALKVEVENDGSLKIGMPGEVKL